MFTISPEGPGTKPTTLRLRRKGRRLGLLPEPGFEPDTSRIRCLNHTGSIHATSFRLLTGDVAQWLERRNSNPKTLGSIPWRSKVRGTFSIPPSQLLCADFFVSDLPSCAWHAPTFIRTLKIPYPSVVKEPVVLSNENTAYNRLVIK